MMSAPSAFASSSEEAWTAGPDSSISFSSSIRDCWSGEASAGAVGSAAQATAATANSRRARRRRVSVIRDIPTPRPDRSFGLGLLGCRVQLGDLAPVDDVPERVEVVRALVLVLEVVRVLPHVGAQQRGLAGG